LQTFFVIVKTLGDLILPLAGAVIGLCAVAPSFTKWLLKKEEAFKSSSLARRVFGIGLMTFCGIYLFAAISLQLNQSKEQSPIYQNQTVVKHHCYELAGELEKLADDYQTNSSSPSSTDQMIRKTELETYYGNRLEPRLETVINQLDGEGLHTNSLERIYPVFPGPNEVRSIARDIKSLAAKLPKSALY
jgi:hypothetical protein